MREIFRALVGSQAYGTATLSSDFDYKGVYVQPIMDILCNGYKPQVEVGKDDTSYEVRRFLELAQSANPTILELIFMPSDKIILMKPEFEIIRDARYSFLSKECRNSFGGYAVAQIKKAKGLNKKGNMEKERVERKTPLDFCYVYRMRGEPIGNGESDFISPSSPVKLTEIFIKYGNVEKIAGLSKLEHLRNGYLLWLPQKDVEFKGLLNSNGDTLLVSQIPKGIKPWYYLYFNIEAYQVHCKEYASYQTWLKERNVARYVDFENHGQLIDGKNMLHCVRLLDMAKEIAKNGELTVRRPNADYLLSIRRGEVNLQSIIDKCEDDIVELDELYEKCSLPDKCDRNFADNLLMDIRQIQLGQWMAGQ